jgi:hypothetical protein
VPWQRKASTLPYGPLRLSILGPEPLEKSKQAGLYLPFRTAQQPLSLGLLFKPRGEINAHEGFPR